MNHLRQANTELENKITALRDEQQRVSAERKLPKLTDYPLQNLYDNIATALSERWGQGRLLPQFELIDRAKFGGDIAVKIPQLLRDGGPKGFIEKHLPWVTEVLQGEQFADYICEIETRGMYINLTLSQKWLLSSAQAICDFGEDFGFNSQLTDRRYIVDYSSPNVAKVLHAGHIRSTIIGHVLSNLYETCGGQVFRFNHINDFGGFGFVLEGYRRFQAQFPADFSENDKLLAIYSIRRTLEKAVAGDYGDVVDGFEQDAKELINRYLPEAKTLDDVKAAFADFEQVSDKRFAALEQGDEEEVALWKKMVVWSLEDFDSFYQKLNVNIDYVVGESFYYDAGSEVVQRCLASGGAVEFTQELADKELAKIEAKKAGGDMSDAEYDIARQSVEKDIGAVLVALDDGTRYVIQRSDGNSIYATRDLGAIELRKKLFDPTDIIYVVGQEQRVHFSRLFNSAYQTGLADKDKMNLLHLYFGFYVDSDTGKKLSSRDTVANVNHLLSQSVEYFHSKLSERLSEDEQELQKTAKELAVGSLVFNDLKQDMKGSVDINTTNLQATIAGFEKSGGAYVVYSACRARSILRRLEEPVKRVEDIAEFDIDVQEAALILKLQQTPDRIIAAASKSDPALLVRHLMETAALYNSYYAQAKVIVDGKANHARLIITNAVQQVLVNCLKVCHVECPEAI